MTTNMQQTSILAYRTLQSEGKLQPREKELLFALQQIEPANDRQLANHLGWEISAVNGRRNSLVKKEKIREAYKHKSVTGRTVIYWKLVNDTEPTKEWENE